VDQFGLNPPLCELKKRRYIYYNMCCTINEKKIGMQNNKRGTYLNTDENLCYLEIFKPIMRYGKNKR
jgi:hypothetical protein